MFAILAALLAANASAIAAAPAPRALRDLAYVSHGHERQKLDLYLPHTGGAAPVIVYIHGGGWRQGSKDSRLVPAQYTQHGYAVASLDYRLSGDATFPAQIEDCKAAVRWLRAHADEYKLDTDHFAAWGESAGGHLAALLGTTGQIDTFDKGENLRVSSQVQAVVDYYGPTDFLQMDAHALPGSASHDDPHSAESQLVGGPIQQRKAEVEKANPITYVSRATPPFLIAHGDSDRTVPIHQSQILLAALEAAGVSVDLIVLKGAGHSFQGASRKQRADLDHKTKAFLAQWMHRR